MSIPIFEVKKIGLCTSFQDLGRYGFQRYGVVTSGVMDRFSYQMANVLVGNSLNKTCIEIGQIGPTLEFKNQATFSICGANLSPHLNGLPIKCWKTYRVKDGDVLTFGRPVSGCYAYLAVSGGFEVEKWMESSSTYSKAMIGPLINQGDVVYGNPRTLRRNRGLNYCDIPTYKQEVVVRYIPGPHLEYFEKDSTRLFEGQSFTYIQGDRMGSRLKATKPIPFQKPTQLPSDPIPFGAIQVPPDGNPIVLMADRQTTGGYPRIGTVISIDIPKLAQLQLGGKVQFQPVTIEEAQSLNILQQKTFNIWNKTTRFN